MSRQALGKGLGALLPPKAQDDVKTVEIAKVDPNPYQPRKVFDEASLQELADSIKEHGVLQPILVRRVEDRYQIVAGERRWRAAGLAGLTEIPAVVKEFNDRLMSQVALVENLQREDLNPLEEAEAYQHLIDEFGMTQETIAESVGKSRTAVANTLRLLRLTEFVKESVSRETISEGHARALLGLNDEKLQDEVCEKVIAEGWSVRATEDYVRRLNEGVTEKTKATKGTKTNIFLQEISEKIGERLGTKVQIKPGKKVNKIEIDFYDNDDLQRILDAIGVDNV